MVGMKRSGFEILISHPNSAALEQKVPQPIRKRLNGSNRR